MSGDYLEKGQLELQAVDAGTRCAGKDSGQYTHYKHKRPYRGKKTPLSGPLCPLGDHQITKDFNHLRLVKTQDFRLQVRTLNKGPSVNAIFFLSISV